MSIFSISGFGDPFLLDDPDRRLLGIEDGLSLEGTGELTCFTTRTLFHINSYFFHSNLLTSRHR
jgi:hypothetical protein